MAPLTDFDRKLKTLPRPTETLKAGDLVFVDSFGGGLVPAKIERIAVRRDRTMIDVRITANRPGYRKGETLELFTSPVVARRAVHVRDHQYRITQLDYTYEVTP